MHTHICSHLIQYFYVNKICWLWIISTNIFSGPVKFKHYVKEAWREGRYIITKTTESGSNPWRNYVLDLTQFFLEQLSQNDSAVDDQNSYTTLAPIHIVLTTCRTIYSWLSFSNSFLSPTPWTFIYPFLRQTSIPWPSFYNTTQTSSECTYESPAPVMSQPKCSSWFSNKSIGTVVLSNQTQSHGVLHSP